MVTLNHQNSPITRAERLKLNENWVTIVEQFVEIQRQFNVLTGSKEVDELLQRIESVITSAEASVSDINELITDVRALIVTTNETIASANTAASNANTKATEAEQATQAANTATASATQAVANIERIMGEYETRVNAAITNSENATQAANTATQESITAKEQTEQVITEAQTATTAANESATRANDSAQNADIAASNANQVAKNMSGYDKPIEDFTLGKTFLKHQAARFNGSTYRAKVETTGNPLPTDPVVENDWWTLEAKRGTDGEGSVGSVNGKLPDDSGNVQIDVGVRTWDEIENKPTIPTVGTAGQKNTGTTSGTIPVIGSDNKLDASIIPAIAITDTFVIASQTAMLALTAQVGDVAVRTDLNKSFILKTDGASVIANWQELLTPSSPVQSVAGKTGAVTLTKSDVGLGNVDNTTDANKPISNATKTALNDKAPLSSPTFTGTPKTPTAPKGTNTTQLASTEFVQTAVADVTASLGTKIIVSASQPTGANVGDLWYEVEV